MYNYDVPRFYAKVLARHARIATEKSGLVPDIAPEFTVFSGGFRDPGVGQRVRQKPRGTSIRCTVDPEPPRAAL